MHITRRLAPAVTVLAVLTLSVNLAGAAGGPPPNEIPETSVGTNPAPEPPDLSDGAQPAPAWTWDPDEEIDPATISARMAHEDIDAAEAEKRLRIDQAAGGLNMELVDQDPDFAGIWITQNPTRVHVAFTPPGAARAAEVQARFAFPDLVVAEQAALSLTRLEEIQNRIGAVRADAQNARSGVPPAIAATGGRFDTSIDVAANTVTVQVPPTTGPDFVDEIRSIARGPVEVDRTTVSQPARCPSQFNCGDAMIGGLEITSTSSGGNACSSSFIARSGSTDFLLSAGHCYQYANGPTYPFWHHDGLYFGSMTAWGMSGTSDVMRVQRETTFKLGSKVFKPNADAYMLTSYRTWSSFVTGQFMAKVGYRTGETTGTITQTNFSPQYVPSSSRFLVATNCTFEGDSGGAVYASRAGAGIISGKIVNPSCTGTGPAERGFLIFGAADYAASRIGVTLLTNVNISPTAGFTYSCSLLGSCTFTATGSNDPDGSIVSYSWTFGDGSAPATGYTTTHQYTSTGAKYVRVTVTDDDGTARGLTKTVKPFPV